MSKVPQINIIWARNCYSCSNYKDDIDKDKWFYEKFFKKDLEDPHLHCKGILQAINLGKNLKESGILIDFLCSSPLLRSVETAKIISKQLSIEEIVVLPFLLSNSEKIKNIPKFIKKCNNSNHQFLETCKYDDSISILNGKLKDLMSFRSNKSEVFLLIVCEDDIIKKYFNTELKNCHIFLEFDALREYGKHTVIRGKQLEKIIKNFSDWENNEEKVFCNRCEMKDTYIEEKESFQLYKKILEEKLEKDEIKIISKKNFESMREKYYYITPKGFFEYLRNGDIYQFDIKDYFNYVIKCFEEINIEKNNSKLVSYLLYLSKIVNLHFIYKKNEEITKTSLRIYKIIERIFYNFINDIETIENDQEIDKTIFILKKLNKFLYDQDVLKFLNKKIVEKIKNLNIDSSYEIILKTYIETIGSILSVFFILEMKQLNYFPDSYKSSSSSYAPDVFDFILISNSFGVAGDFLRLIF